MTTWAALLDELPTLVTSQARDLKVDIGWLRVWLSCCGTEDGEPFARTVYVQQHRPTGLVWVVDVGYYDGDEPDPQPREAAAAEAYRLTRERAVELRAIEVTP